MKILTKVTCGMAVFGLFGIANIAKATEGGGSTYPGGAENYLGSCPASGLYVLEYGQMYTADSVKDNSGNRFQFQGSNSMWLAQQRV